MDHTAKEKSMPLLDEHDRVLAHTTPDSLPDKTGTFLQWFNKPNNRLLFISNTYIVLFDKFPNTC